MPDEPSLTLCKGWCSAVWLQAVGLLPGMIPPLYPRAHCSADWLLDFSQGLRITLLRLFLINPVLLCPEGVRAWEIPFLGAEVLCLDSD